MQSHIHSLQLNEQVFQQLIPEEHLESLRIKLEPIPLKPIHDEKIVAAVDTSTMKIAETNAGIVLAVRGATVWKQNENYRYTRLGPFIFHVTDDNKEVYNAIRSYFSSIHGQNARFTICCRCRPYRHFLEDGNSHAHKT
jgi:hypothetical protein